MADSEELMVLLMVVGIAAVCVLCVWVLVLVAMRCARWSDRLLNDFGAEDK